MAEQPRQSSKEDTEEILKLEQNFKEMQEDRELALSQKVKKRISIFDKNDYSTWRFLSEEDTNKSRDNLIEKKISLLKKIEDTIANQQKIEIELELKIIERQIAILGCVLDMHQLYRDVKNFKDRRERTHFRVEKVLKDRDGFYIMRENLNSLWESITSDTEELCTPLPLKANAKYYFV